MPAASLFVQNAQYFLSEEYLPKISRCLHSLTTEQIWWRPNEEANSIGNLILHLEGNMRQWIISGVGGASDIRRRQSEFDERRLIPAPELLEKISTTVYETCSIIVSLTEEQLLEPRTIQGKNVNVFHAVFRVVEHFSMHTGQILYITKLITRSSLEFYTFKDGVPQKNW